MSDPVDNLKYWEYAGELSDAFLRAIEFARDTAPAHSERDIDLSAIENDLWHVRNERREVASLPRPLGEQIVDPGEKHFVRAVEMLQRQLLHRLERKLDGQECLRAMLVSNTEELAKLYGSLSLAWDLLVKAKYETTGPNATRRNYNSWLIMLVTELEHYLRETVLAAMTLTEVPMVLQAIAQAEQHLDDAGIVIRLSDLIKSLTVQDVVASYMDRGSKQTIELACLLGECLSTENVDVRLFPGSVSLASMVGCLAPWLAPTGESSSSIVEQTCDRLLEIRRRLLHQSSAHPSDELDEILDSFYRLSVEELRDLADVVGAIALHFGLRVAGALAAASEDPSGIDPDLVLTHQHKVAAELRYLELQLLEQQRWGLGWVLCDVGLHIEPAGSHGTMHRLNGIFARMRLRDRVRKDFGARSDALALDRQFENSSPPPAPRHSLYLKSLLHDFAGIEELLDRVVEIGDMTDKELRGWPGLVNLRASDEWRKWCVGRGENP